MNPLSPELTAHLLTRLDRLQRQLGDSPAELASPDTLFADLLDSMGLVEFVALLAADCGVPPGAIEAAVNRHFGTVAQLAQGLLAAGLVPRDWPTEEPSALAEELGPASRTLLPCWLAATAVQLPDRVQPAWVLDEMLQRPTGWPEQHAGIRQRCLWGEQDPVEAAAVAGRACLEQAGLLVDEVGALLVTSEAPPLLVGLAATLHQHLELRPEAPALEVGGACTGYLAALWLGQRLLAGSEVVLVLAVEAPSRLLVVEPGPAGEAAALFGDAAAASVLCRRPAGSAAVPVQDILLGSDGSEGNLLRVDVAPDGPLRLHMEGPTLATRAVRALTEGVVDLLQRHRLDLADLAGIVVHGGNGRLPALVARRLGLPSGRVWSRTAETGNLGSASLPVAWTAQQPPPTARVAWAAVGAGLTWGAALTGQKYG